MFQKLQEINRKPEPFEEYTRLKLWNDEHISKGMLKAHLDPLNDAASRNKAFIDKSVQWILLHFNIDESSNIIDFGCGPGLYTKSFAEVGAQVTGLDFSERSINYAKETALENHLNIDYRLQNYLEYSTAKRFDLITMIWCDFSALSPTQRKKLLVLFASILSDNGKILLDVDSMNRFRNAEQMKTSYEGYYDSGFYSSKPYHLFNAAFKYENESLLLNKDTVIQQNDQFELLHWAQCFSLKSIKEEFAENGLNIIENYSDVAGTPFFEDSPVIAVVAEKR